MSKSILILTKKNLTLLGMKTPLEDLGYKHFRFSKSNLFKTSDLVVFVENPNLIIVKDRYDSYSAGKMEDTRKRYIELKRQVLRPCIKQRNYLYNVLKNSNFLQLPSEEKLLIITVIKRDWYPDTYKDELNDLRKKYVNKITIGTMT